MREDTYAEEGPPSTLPSGALQSIAARPSPGVAVRTRRLSSSETRTLLIELARQIADSNVNAPRHTQADAFSNQRRLEEALAELQKRFKPASCKEGETPSEKQIKASLLAGYRAAANDRSKVSEVDTQYLLEPFTKFVAQHAEALGLVGTKQAARRASPRAKAASQTIADPAWQARNEALPAQTADVRTYVRYSGTDLNAFLGEMNLPRGARAFERFKLDFYEATGITFDAFSRWGSIRRPPSRTDSDGIRRVWNALTDQAIEESRIEPLLQSHRPNSVPAEVWQGRIDIARQRGVLRELALEAIPNEISEGDWNLLVDYHARHHQTEEVTVEPARGEASINAVVGAYIFLNNYLRSQRPGRVLDLWDYLAAIYPVVRRMLVREDVAAEKTGAADYSTIQFRLPERILGGLDAETNLGLSTFAQRVWDGSFVSGVNPSTMDGHARGRVEHPEHSTIRQYVRPLALASSEDPEQRAEIERDLYLLMAGLFRVFPVLDRLDPMPGREGEQTVPASQRADTRMTLMPSSDTNEYAKAQREKRDELEPKVRRGYYDARLSIAREQIDYYSHLSGVEGISNVRISLVNGAILSPAEMDARLESAAGNKQGYDDAVRRIPGVANHSQEAIRAFYSRLHETTEEVLFWSQANGELATPLGAMAFVTALRRAGQSFETRGATVLYLDDIFGRAQAEGWNSDARTSAAIRLRIIVGHVLRNGDLSPDDIADAEAIATAALPYWTAERSGLDQAAKDLARMEADALPADLRSALPAVHQYGVNASAAREIIERGPVLPVRRLSPPWREQWMAHAARTGLPALAMQRAVDAMMEYFETARGYLVDYNDQALARAIDNRCAGLQHEPIKQAILSFFATVGMANQARALDEASALQTELADRAFKNYIDGLPRERGVDAQVEINMALLRACVAAACEGNRQARPLTVLALLFACVQAFNSQRSTSGISTEDGKFLPGSGLSGAMQAERATAIFTRMVDDAQHGFVRFVREGYEAQIMSDAQLRAFALRYLAARLASDADVDVDAIAASVIGEPAGFVTSNEVRSRFAGYYRTFLHRWLSSRDSEISGTLSHVHAAIEEAIDWTPPPMSVAELIDAATRSVANAPSSGSLRSQEDELRLLRGIYPRSTAYEGIDSHAQRLFNSEKAADVREAFQKRVHERNGELTEIATRAADLARRSAELFLGWERVNVTGAATAEAIIGSMLASISSMDIVDLSTFIRDADARYASLAELETELDKAKGLPARAEKLVAELGSFKSGDMTAEKVGAKLDDAGTHLRNLEEVITQTHDAASSRLKNLRAKERERIALARAHEAIESAKDVAMEIDAAIFESRTLAPAVEEYETMSEIVSDQLREDGITPDAFRTAMQEAADRKAAGKELATHADFLAERIHRLIGNRSDEKIESGINLTMAPARTALMDLNEAGEGLSEKGSEEVMEATVLLAKAIIDAEAAIKEIDALIRRINAASASIAPAIDAAEEVLPIAPDAALPDPLPEEASEASADAALKESSSGKYHAEAQRALAPILNAGLLSMPLRGESRFISSDETARYNAWVESSRADPIRFTDIFSRTFTLADGVRGSRLVPTNELPASSALAALVRNLSLALSGPSTEARAISVLTKRPGAEQLLQDLFATLARTPATDAASARAAVRSWILAHRQAFCDAVGTSDAERFFPAEKPPASDRPTVEKKKKIEHIYPPSYTAKAHAASVAGRDLLLAHPEVGMVSFTLRDGRESRLYADYFQMKESINGARLTGFIPPPEIRLFDSRTGQWKMRRLPEDADPATIDFERPPTLSNWCREIEGRRMMREIFSNPDLRDLGYAIQQAQAPRNAAMERFFHNLFDPIARTLPDMTLLFTLEEAQTMARDVFLNSKKHPEFMKQFDRVFCEPDPELALQHPETAFVNSISLLDSAARITALSKTSMLARFRASFPEFGGVYAILDLLGTSIGQDFMDDFAGLCLKHEKSANSILYGKEEFRGLFRELYHKYSATIREALGQEHRPGLTRARLLTGMDDPWNGELTWERLTPMQRLVMKAPVFGRIKDSWTEDTYKNLHSRMGTFALNTLQRQDFENFAAVFERFPNLRNVLGIASHCFEDAATPEKRAALDKLYDICARAEEALIEDEFVELVTDPVNLRIIYEELEKKNPERDGKMYTWTEAMTGDATPAWMTTSKTAPTMDASGELAALVDTPKKMAALKAVAEALQQTAPEKKKGSGGEGQGGLPSAPAAPAAPASPSAAPAPTTSSASPFSSFRAALSHPIGAHPVITGGMMEIPHAPPADVIVIEGGEETFAAGGKSTEPADAELIDDPALEDPALLETTAPIMAPMMRA